MDNLSKGWESVVLESYGSLIELFYIGALTGYTYYDFRHERINADSNFTNKSSNDINEDWWWCFLIGWILYIGFHCKTLLLYFVNWKCNASSRIGYKVFKNNQYTLIERCIYKFQRKRTIIMKILLIILSGITLSEFFSSNVFSPNSKRIVSAINVLLAWFTMELTSPKIMKLEVAKSILKHLLDNLGHLFGYMMAFFIIIPQLDSNNEDSVFSNIFDSFFKVE